jgi:hypothetical protein
MGLESRKLKYDKPVYSMPRIAQSLGLPPCDEEYPNSEARM